MRCTKNFKEEDIIATSTSKRYCYDCATKINLVTGNMKRDLYNDEFISKVLQQIKLLAEKFAIDKETSTLALLLIKTVFENTNYVSKNHLGLSCAAISLSCKIKKQNLETLNIIMPVEDKVLQKNLNSLSKKLMNANITTLSKILYDGGRILR